MPDTAPYGGFARIYDDFMDDFNYAAWCAFYLDFAGAGGAKTALEAACGTGSMTRELAKRRLAVIACDVSEQMLSIAQQKCRRYGGAAFVRQDMRELEIHKPVDLVIACCDAVNYLPGGAEDFFAAAYKCLKPGGVLAFDISSAEKLKSAHGQVFFDDREDASCIWTNDFCGETGILMVELIMFFKTAGGLYEKRCESHALKAFEPADIERSLKKIGFTGIKTVLPDDSVSYRKGRFHFAAIKEQV